MARKKKRGKKKKPIERVNVPEKVSVSGNDADVSSSAGEMTPWHGDKPIVQEEIAEEKEETSKASSSQAISEDGEYDADVSTTEAIIAHKTQDIQEDPKRDDSEDVDDEVEETGFFVDKKEEATREAEPFVEEEGEGKEVEEEEGEEEEEEGKEGREPGEEVVEEEKEEEEGMADEEEEGMAEEEEKEIEKAEGEKAKEVKEEPKVPHTTLRKKKKKVKRWTVGTISWKGGEWRVEGPNEVPTHLREPSYGFLTKELRVVSCCSTGTPLAPHVRFTSLLLLLEEELPHVICFQHVDTQLALEIRGCSWIRKKYTITDMSTTALAMHGLVILVRGEISVVELHELSSWLEPGTQQSIVEREEHGTPFALIAKATINSRSMTIVNMALPKGKEIASRSIKRILPSLRMCDDAVLCGVMLDVPESLAKMKDIWSTLSAEPGYTLDTIVNGTARKLLGDRQERCDRVLFRSGDDYWKPTTMLMGGREPIEEFADLFVSTHFPVVAKLVTEDGSIKPAADGVQEGGCLVM